MESENFPPEPGKLTCARRDTEEGRKDASSMGAAPRNKVCGSEDRNREPLSGRQLESGSSLTPRYDSAGLIPAIAIDWKSGQVLMMAWMNEEALAKTLVSGQAHYWSRSRECLWHKGSTSGSFQNIKDIRVDCDQDTLLLVVEQRGEAACHTGRKSCFYRKVDERYLQALRHKDGPRDHEEIVRQAALVGADAKSIM